MHASAFLSWLVCFCLIACFRCSLSLLLVPSPDSWSLSRVSHRHPLPLSFMPSHSHRSRFLLFFVYHCFYLSTFSLPLSESVAPPLDGADYGAGGSSALALSLLFTFAGVEMLSLETSLSPRISSSGSHSLHIDLCRARGSFPWAASHIASSPLCRASASACSHVALSRLFLDFGVCTHAHRFPFSSSLLCFASSSARAYAYASASLSLSLSHIFPLCECAFSRPPSFFLRR